MPLMPSNGEDVSCVEKTVVMPTSGNGRLMPVRYKIHESPDCFIYDRSEKPQIYLYDFDDGGITHHSKLQGHVIAFMLEGSISITFPDRTKHLFRKGQMMFMPAGSIYTWNIREYMQLLVYQLQPTGFRLCEKFPIESLYSDDAKYLWAEDGEEMNIDEEKAKERFSVLKIHPRLLQRLESVCGCFIDGVRCKKFFEKEIENFFILLRCYYSKKELYSFMRFIMTGNMVFTEYVRLRWKEFSTVASLAASMSMTTKHFSRMFMLSFGQRPSLWMANNRARLIFDELTASDKSLKQIAFNNGFTSISQFSKFTKRVLGKTASEIRNGGGDYSDS